MPKHAVGHVYELTHIDRWLGWRRVPNSGYLRDAIGMAVSVRSLVCHAKEQIVRRTCWDGSGWTFVSAMPYPDVEGWNLFVAVKQSNNGLTFCWSPVELPWCKELEVERG